MTRSDQVKSINCTSCGAGLDILGGGRVVVHVCGYCGSQLDAQDSYKILKTFSDVERPQSPFSIGMTGVIQGVEFTIIGTLGLEETYEGRTWRWVDHQLFSPTHGYAFLTVEDGHFVFSRRYRKETTPRWLSPLSVEIAEHRPIVFSGGEKFRYYEGTVSRVTFVEGEFNWQPELGEMASTVSVLSDDAMLGFTDTGTEHEIERSVYLDHYGTLTTFGATPISAPVGVHPLQPYHPRRNEGFLKKVSAGFAALCLGLALYLAALSGGRTTAEEQFQVTSLPVEIPIEIQTPSRLARIRVTGDVHNSWAYVGFALSDPEDVPVFEAGRQIERYSGRDHEGSWSEGSKSASLRFIPRQAGTYSLEISLEEAETWQRTGTPLSTITVQVDEAIASPFYMLGLAVIFLVMAIIVYGRYYVHQRRRWWNSDWVEEDDD